MTPLSFPSSADATVNTLLAAITLGTYADAEHAHLEPASKDLEVRHRRAKAHQPCLVFAVWLA